MPTITAIAVGDARFNILVNALQYIDAQIPGSNLVTTLDTAGANVTVFAPTDAAFGKLATSLGYTGAETDEAGVTAFLVANVPAATLKDIVLYHVSPGAKTLAQVAALDDVPTLLTGATFGPDGTTLVDNEPDLIDPSLVVTDINADNGIIHAIDRVLLPIDLPGNDAPTITGIVAASGAFDRNGADFDLLLQAVTTAGLAGTLDDAAADLTVFAPNDAAFLGLAQALGFQGSDESRAFDFVVDALTLLSGGGNPIPLLTQILTYHVSPGSLQASQVLALDEIPTLQGATLARDGTTLQDADPDLPDPSLIVTDIQAANGVVHVINGVLIPADILQSDGSNDVDFIIDGKKSSFISTGDDRDFVDGNSGADIISAGDGDDVALGGGSRDFLSGRGGNDILRGESGADLVAGGQGDDMIYGGNGSDRMLGNSGADIFVFEAGTGRDRVMDFRDGEDKIDLSAFDLRFADVQASLSAFHGGVRITLDGGPSIDLIHTTIGQLDRGDFIL
jgi:serralysin